MKKVNRSKVEEFLSGGRGDTTVSPAKSPRSGKSSGKKDGKQSGKESGNSRGAASLTLPPPRQGGRRRIMLSVPPELHARLERLAQERGEPTATLCTTLLGAAVDALE